MDNVAHIASSRPLGVTRRVEELGVCSTCVSGHFLQFWSSVRERPQLAIVFRVSVVQNKPSHSSSGVRFHLTAGAQPREVTLFVSTGFMGMVKEARNVLFTPLTAREKKALEMASDDSLELKVGSSSHKAPEPWGSLEACALMSVLLKSKGFFCVRRKCSEVASQSDTEDGRYQHFVRSSSTD